MRTNNEKSENNNENDDVNVNFNINVNDHDQNIQNLGQKDINNPDRHGFDREFAWRVFAGEYNKTSYEQTNTEVRAPSYLITPLGARINRIFIVGVLTELEKIERNGNITYRARVSDRTGVFYVYAGQFDPKVTKILSSLEPPTYIAVVGKSRLYSPKDGVTYVSIRPESVVEVDKSVLDYWLIDTCKSMKQRLEAIVEAQKMDEPELENLVKLGFSSEVANGVLEALKHYNSIDISAYKGMLIDVLKHLLLENGLGFVDTGEVPLSGKNIQDVTAEFKTGDQLNNDEEDSSLELEFESDIDQTIEIPNLAENQEQLLEVIGSFNNDKYNDGVPWHELVAVADSKGIDKLYIEDIVNDLMEKGKVYEPMLGRIKLMES
jgi:RPA family protein